MSASSSGTGRLAETTSVAVGPVYVPTSGYLCLWDNKHQADGHVHEPAKMLITLFTQVPLGRVQL